MKVYVAGAWVEQHLRARPMIARLRAAGIEITFDWTQTEGDVCACGHHRNEHQPFISGSRSREVGCAHKPTEGAGFDCPCTCFNGVGSGGDSVLTADKRREFALADMNGVITADVVWVLAAETEKSSGTWVELGAALVNRDLVGPPMPRRRVIIVSGSQWQRNIFTELADHHFEFDEAAFAAILGLLAHERSI